MVVGEEEEGVVSPPFKDVANSGVLSVATTGSLLCSFVDMLDLLFHEGDPTFAHYFLYEFLHEDILSDRFYRRNTHNSLGLDSSLRVKTKSRISCSCPDLEPNRCRMSS